MNGWQLGPAIHALVLVISIAALGCRDDSCIDRACALPCARVSFGCSPQALYIGPVRDAPLAYRLQLGNGAIGDTLISNGIVTAVISGLDAPNDLAPTGGNLIDLGPAGGVDDLTIVYQLSGILPDDAFAYRSLEIVKRDGSVGVTVRGTLDGRPEVLVATHYELGACDPGLRVRSEMFNGSADTQVFTIADTSHWGRRRVVPFVPAKGQGYLQPELDLLELTALWDPHDHVGGATPGPDSPGYASISCDREELYGVSDLEISAIGTPMTFSEPGDTIVFERMLFAAGQGAGPAPAIESALAARAQMFDTPTIAVSGRILAGGMPFGGDVRRVSVMLLADGAPVSAVVPAADGTFATTVRGRGAVTAEVWSFGRKVLDASGPAFGDLVIDEPATVQLGVTRGVDPIHALVAFHPADDATRAAVTGTFHGRLLECSPWLGPPTGASPACNQVIVVPAGTEIEVPAGRYQVFASAGPEHTIAKADLELTAGQIEAVALSLVRLAVAPPGWLSVDLHVHGRASFDSGLPDDDRVRSFAAAGVAVIAATDHDAIGDYTDTVARLGLEAQIAVMGGLETTQVIPWLDVPGEDVPRVIGHFNFWPLRKVPSAPRAGAPSGERLEPGELFDRMEPLLGPRGMMQMNHPWADPLFGRDLGYLRAIKYDPRRPIDDAATNNPVLLETPGGKHRNIDWNAIEILNGANYIELQRTRVVWFSLLAQGLIAAGTGNSDSHGMNDNQLGWARNWVDTTTTVGTFDANVLNTAIRDGRMVTGNGIVITVEVGPPAGPRRGLGLTPYAIQPGDVVAITVRAPPWVPVDEVRIVTSQGTRVIASGSQLVHPTDPFGTAGVLRYEAMLPARDLVAKDDFVVVEAGLAYPEAADFDDDGVPDTTDNNGDGVVDKRDIEPDEDAGPFTVPPDPREPSDKRYWVTRVVPGAWPMAFANPLLLDVDGGTWTAPGLP